MQSEVSVGVCEMKCAYYHKITHVHKCIWRSHLQELTNRSIDVGETGSRRITLKTKHYMFQM